MSSTAGKLKSPERSIIEASSPSRPGAPAAEGGRTATTRSRGGKSPEISIAKTVHASGEKSISLAASSSTGADAGTNQKKTIADFLEEESRPSIATAGTVDDPGKKFRDRLMKLLTSEPSRDGKLFMAKSDEYPRFLWRNVLLSSNSWQADNVQWGKEGLSRIVRQYPDILQRELLRDSLQILGTKEEERAESYGVLYAAVLYNSTADQSGTLLVSLLMERDTYSAREKICEILTPTHEEDVRDPFHLIRRALLWRLRWSPRETYEQAATVMRVIEKAIRNPKELGELTGLINRQFRPNMNDLMDAHNPDPWAVVLAWASLYSRYDFILREFEIVHKGSRDEIKKTLRDSELKLAADIVQLLVVGTLGKYDNDSPPAVGGPFGNAEEYIMERCFLDRLCEKSPKNLWTPLHLAAARGDVEIVEALIRCCEECLKALPEDWRKKYTKQILKSLHDSKHMTPLHHAVLHNKQPVVEALMNWEVFRSLINDTDIFMRSAFQIACTKPERSEIARVLYNSHWVKVDREDCCSFTPLHWAVHSGSQVIAELLIDGGRTVSKGGLVSIIREYAHREIQQHLLNRPSIISEIDRLYKDRQVYVDGANAVLVGAALIASVTFGGWRDPPGGNDLDHDSVEVQIGVHIFWACSSLSFFFAIATVMAGASTVLPYRYSDGNMKYTVESLRNWLLLNSFLLLLSVASVLGAFTAAGFSSLLGSRPLKTNMTITTAIGFSVCGFIGVLYFRKLFHSRRLGLNQKVGKTSKLDLKEVDVKKYNLKKRNLTDPADRCSRWISPLCIRRPKVDPGKGELTHILSNLPKIHISATSEPIREAAIREYCIRKHWRTFGHLKEGSKTVCVFRNCYPQLESTSLDDLSEVKVIDTRAFDEVWSSLIT
ncbi:unnamed protein product [Calypogeia fissa]